MSFRAFDIHVFPSRSGGTMVSFTMPSGRRTVRAELPLRVSAMLSVFIGAAFMLVGGTEERANELTDELERAA